MVESSEILSFPFGICVLCCSMYHAMEFERCKVYLPSQVEEPLDTTVKPVTPVNKTMNRLGIYRFDIQMKSKWMECQPKWDILDSPH